MNISSALIKQIIAYGDFETWSYLRKDYLAKEFHRVHDAISKHTEDFHKLPTFDDLKLGVRDNSTKEKLYAIENVEVEIEPSTLLQYLKNEYTQREILNELEDFIDDSLLFESAEESVDHLHSIVLNIEQRVELEKPQESMQRLPLWESDEELSKYVALGLNEEYDSEYKFAPDEYILIGGKRGSGKSLVCANIAVNMAKRKRSAIYFTIEMPSRAILMRACAIATGVPHNRIRNKSLSVQEWRKVASWWSNRYIGGEAYYEKYLVHNDFDQLHADLSTKCVFNQAEDIDVIYDPELTVSKIKAELDKRIKQHDVGIIIIDYVNQVKRFSAGHHRGIGGQYDWTEQIEVSKALKAMAQEYKTPIVSPYQIDASGEARFSKGLLDSCDAAFILIPHSKEDKAMTFENVKMRNSEEVSFTSEADWDTLKFGPKTVLSPEEREQVSHKVDEKIQDDL